MIDTLADAVAAASRLLGLRPGFRLVPLPVDGSRPRRRPGPGRPAPERTPW